MKWAKLTTRMSIYARGTPNGNEEIKNINDMALNLIARKVKSTIWVRFIPFAIWSSGGPQYEYEVLIPAMTDRQIEIWKDLGYILEPVGYMSRLKRREKYRRITK